MKNETFFEVLKSEVRKDIQRELAQDLELENQARLDSLSASQRHSATHQHEQLSTWLATHLDPFQTKTSGSKTKVSPTQRSYQAQKQNQSQTWAQNSTQKPTQKSARPSTGPKSSQPQQALSTSQTVETAAPEIRYCATTPSEILALRLLNTNGASLSETFSETELKQAWKKQALRSHPDRFPNAAPQELKRLNQDFAELIQAHNVLKNCPPLK